MAFIFDAQKGQTPASVARQRQIAEMLMGKTGYRPVNNVGEGIGAGLSALASGFGARIANKRADAAEAAGMQGANSVYDQLVASLTGQGGNLASQPVEYSPTASVSAPPATMDPSARVAQAFSDEQSPFPGAAPKQDRLPQQTDIEGYIRQAAAERGIDPDIAVRVAMSEGGVTDPIRQSDVVKNGVREQSYGPFQLYMNGGLGNEALAAGIDPRKDWQGGVNFALDKAKEGGWGPWYGAQRVGITGMDGIGGAQAAMTGETAPVQTAQQSPGLSVQQLMQAASNPWLNENQRGVINMMLEQEMKRADPSNQLDMDYRRAQIEKLQREAEQGGRDGTHGTPFYTMDADGNLHVNFASKSGDKLIRAEAGNGEKVLGPYDTSLMRSTGQYEGKDQGEARALYDSMVSKMPGLRSVVDQLDTLTEEATYTWAGRAWDEARKQFDLDPRAEAVARSQYTAIVDNQILPLLRDTFGAQFTVAEGESLRATLGDPNKSPPEKKAVLQAFIQQKERDIEALARRTGQEAPAAPSGGDWQDVGGIKIRRKQ